MAAMAALHLSIFDQWKPEFDTIIEDVKASGMVKMGCNHCTGWMWAEKAATHGVPIVEGSAAYLRYSRHSTAAHGSHAFLGNGNSVTSRRNSRLEWAPDGRAGAHRCIVCYRGVHRTGRTPAPLLTRMLAMPRGGSPRGRGASCHADADPPRADFRLRQEGDRGPGSVPSRLPASNPLHRWLGQGPARCRRPGDRSC